MLILEEILAPYPQVAIVLSTSWVRARSFDFVKAQLSPALQQRVIGATYHRREMNKYVFLSKPRWKQIAEGAGRRQPGAWVTLEDDVEGCPEEQRECLVQTNEKTRVAERQVWLRANDWLKKYALSSTFRIKMSLLFQYVIRFIIT